MRGLLLLAWRSLVARRPRALLTIAGVALGVAVVVTSVVMNAAIDGSVARTGAAIAGRTDLRVETFAQGGLTADEVARISSTSNVAIAAPEIERRTYLLETGATTTSRSIDVLGTEPALDTQLHDLPLAPGALIASAAEAGEGDVLISDGLARLTGAQVGGSITLLGSGAPESFRVAGIVQRGVVTIGSTADGLLAVIRLDAARRLFGIEGATRVDLAVEIDRPVDGVVAAIEAAPESAVYRLSRPADLVASLGESTTDFRSSMALIAAIALFAGAFLIFNALSMTVAERIREVGLLRAAGASRGFVHLLVLGQAAFLGLIGSASGITVGLFLAALGVRAIGTAGMVPIEPVPVPAGGLALAAGLGMMVTLAAALEPAIRAGRISPVEALRARVERGAGMQASLRWLVVVAAAVAVAGFTLWPSGAGWRSYLSPILVYAVLLGTTVLAPFILRPLARIARIPFALVLRAEERLARGSLLRDRSRTALTLGSLTVGIAMIVGTAGVAEAARAGADSWVRSVIPGDEVYVSIFPRTGGEEVAAQLAAVRGVERVSPFSAFTLDLEGSRVDAVAVTGGDLLEDGRLNVVEGDRDQALRALDDTGAIVLPRIVADRIHAHVGDKVTVQSSAGAMPLTVSGIVSRSLPGETGEAVLVGWPDATAYLGLVGADRFAIRYERGAQATAAPEVATLATETLALERRDLVGLQGVVHAELGLVFDLFDGLAIVAMLVAGLGIVNTLTMSVVERRTEIGVLRAVGASRGQVARMILVEAGALGLIGIFLGCVAGFFVEIILLIPFGLAGPVAVIRIPWEALGIAAGLGTLVAMAAAWYPARVAASISPVGALHGDARMARPRPAEA